MGFIPTSTAAGLTALDDGDVTPGPLAEAKAVVAKAIDDHGASIVVGADMATGCRRPAGFDSGSICLPCRRDGCRAALGFRYRRRGRQHRSGTVRIDGLDKSIRDAWGIKRAGGRIQTAIERAVDHCVRMLRISKDGEFLSMPGTEPVVRDRSVTRSPNLRKADMLPPTELRVAIVQTVRDHYGAGRDQIVPAVSRAIGIKVTSALVKDAILQVVDAAIADGTLTEQGDLVVPA